MKWLMIMVTFLSASTAMAEGKKLHDNNCLQCHSALMAPNEANEIYTRADRKITSLDGLAKRVSSCALAADANWTSEQRQQVVRYLADTYYHF